VGSRCQARHVFCCDVCAVDNMMHQKIFMWKLRGGAGNYFGCVIVVSLITVRPWAQESDLGAYHIFMILLDSVPSNKLGEDGGDNGLCRSSPDMMLLVLQKGV
jgi:hypothetical protein